MTVMQTVEINIKLSFHSHFSKYDYTRKQFSISSFVDQAIKNTPYFNI